MHGPLKIPRDFAFPDPGNAMGEGHSRAMYPENPGFCSSQPDKVQRAEPVSMEFCLLGCVNENCVFPKKILVLANIQILWIAFVLLLRVNFSCKFWVLFKLLGF